MRITHAKFWTEADGSTWHSMWEWVPGKGKEGLSMGPLRDPARSIAWCAKHGVKVDDSRTATA